MIKRKLQTVLEKYLFKGKAIIITGARQVGKTTLVKALAESAGRSYSLWNCDEPDVEQYLDRRHPPN